MFDFLIFDLFLPLKKKKKEKRKRNLQILQQETTIDLEAIQNKDVQIFMDNFNIHSLYN